MKTIEECKIEKSKIDPSTTNVWVRFKGEKEFNVLFTFFSNEISFDAEELIGLSDKDALALRLERDLAFLRS